MSALSRRLCARLWRLKSVPTGSQQLIPPNNLCRVLGSCGCPTPLAALTHGAGNVTVCYFHHMRDLGGGLLALRCAVLQHPPADCMGRALPPKSFSLPTLVQAPRSAPAASPLLAFCFCVCPPACL